MIVTVVGLGLIGGSIALKLKKENFAQTVLGIDASETHCKQALELGIVDEITTLEDTCKKSDLVILAIPVNATKKIVPLALNLLNDNAVLVDMGSTKQSICEEVANHSNRNQFVASHPIAGTENTGPTAAFETLFDNKVSIICEKEKSNPKALALVEKMYQTLGMKLAYMNAAEHDLHIAYVSHLSHISSFTLGLTVLDEEKNEKNIFNMAGSGFASTVRLAKSSPEMWAPIFEENSDNLSKALESYIEHLKEFKQIIDTKNTDKALAKMQEANEIRRILNGIELRENKK